MDLSFHDIFPPDPNKITVTEEMHPEKEWYKEACKMKAENLPTFYEKMTKGYNHDYGTAVHAVSACALAAAWAASGEKDIGLSSFQAGIVMWQFIKNWTMSGNKCGLRLIDYDDMLYPQYEEKFEKTISGRAWKDIQKAAKENLEQIPEAHPCVIKHWQSIVDGNVPFGYKVVEMV